MTINIEPLPLRPIIRHNNNNNYIDINKKENAINIIFVLSFLLYIGLSCYNDVIIFKSNDYINEFIKFKNDTEIDYKNHNTFDATVLIFFDVLYFIMYILLNVLIIKKVCSSNACNIILLIGILLIMLILHGAFYVNTSSYLSNKVINIDRTDYKNKLDFSIMLYYLGLVFKVPATCMLYMHYLL
jgi:hypothetical protein